MEYLTVRETSEKWGMSIRMVNYYLNTGRIEGAVRKKSEWLIPYTAKSPLDIRKKADTKKSTKRKRNVNKCYMPLIASPCPGSFHEFEHSLADEEERQITRALWHYFRNEEKECCTVNEQCFNSESVQIRLAARLVHAMATVQEGDPAAVLADFNAIALENKKTSDPSAKLYTLVTEGFVSVFFHSESADLSVLRDKISLCQAGIQYYVIYAAAHELYLRREYQRAMGMAEAALMMAGNCFPIASIYLNLVLCMICMNLKDDEHADAAFMRAWNIALPEHYIHPFIEHHGLLQGQIERSLREQYPDEYNEIIESVYTFSRGWMKIHNPVSTLQVTDALTPYEFSIAMLASKGRSNKEIAKSLGISLNTVKSYLENIFSKLHISSRSELDMFVNR